LGIESYPNALVRLKNKINKNKDRNGVVLVGFNKNPFYPTCSFPLQPTATSFVANTADRDMDRDSGEFKNSRRVVVRQM
jgi:hypothetical protein